MASSIHAVIVTLDSMSRPILPGSQVNYFSLFTFNIVFVEVILFAIVLISLLGDFTHAKYGGTLHRYKITFAVT